MIALRRESPESGRNAIFFAGAAAALDYDFAFRADVRNSGS
jgi:hypothetical protein